MANKAADIYVNTSNKYYPQIPHSALYIDLKYQQLLQALLQYIKPSDRGELLTSLDQLFVKNMQTERILVTVSVRTCLDLYLQTVNYEPGTEIIVTSVNIPDMITIMRYHGLKPVPVEIDKKKLAPTLDDIKKVYKEGVTKAIMISYLFGSKFDATEIFEWAKEKKLTILEDEAESFDGPQRNGHPLADFTFFSFGTIKPFTAFGGAVNIIRNNEGLYRQMKQKLESYSILPSKMYLKKMLKNSALMWALNYELGHDVCRYILTTFVTPNSDYKEFVISKLRGFAPNPKTFLDTFRYQIPIPMLFLLNLRMSQFDLQSFNMQTSKLQSAQNQLLQNGIEVPGHGNDKRTFWLFPIIVPDPDLFFKIIVSRGVVGTYLGATQLKLVEQPLGHYKYPIKTASFFNKLVYLPIHRDVPQHYIDKVIEETIETLKIVNNLHSRQVAEYPKL